MVEKPPTAPTSLLSEMDWLVPGARLIVLVPTGPALPTNVIVAFAVSVATRIEQVDRRREEAGRALGEIQRVGWTRLPFESTLLYAECRDEKNEERKLTQAKPCQDWQHVRHVCPSNPGRLTARTTREMSLQRKRREYSTRSARIGAAKTVELLAVPPRSHPRALVDVFVDSME